MQFLVYSSSGSFLSGKTSGFPDGKLISMLPSGKTGGFPDGKPFLTKSSGKHDDFPDDKVLSV